MRRHRQPKSTERPLPAFTQCPGCSYDFITGEGTRNCHWGDCPYLPQEYNVWCPACNYNFATREGNPHCSDPPTCTWAKEGYQHAALVKKRLGAAKG